MTNITDHRLGFAVVAALAAGLMPVAAIAAPPSTEPPTSAALGPDGLVTEEVEPGVERVIRDDAGHDLDERHPTYRYDMDDVIVTPDGTVWLSTTYSRSDNFANPPGALLWALGQPGTPSLPDVDCFSEGFGVTCVDESEEETVYLAGTPINAIAVAPDGTVWAVGGDDGENGGLYRITRD
jgi:hypothetical protein